MPAGQTRFESRGIIEGRKSKKWIPKPEFCFAHSSISSFYRGSCARDISGWIEHELGDGEDMDRFAILEGVFTPASAVVRIFRIFVRIPISINDLRVAALFRHRLSSRK